MPTAWPRLFRTTTIQNALPASAAETIVAQLVITDPGPDVPVDFDCWALITTGVATTSIVPRIRRNNVAGAVVAGGNLQSIIGAVGSTNAYDLVGTDIPGDVASLTYVLTIVQTAATGAGTLVALLMRAFVGG